jgi:50S ribosomal subunit-associated GTPase HflX
MIEAFKSTLDELTYASLVLLVLDISEPVDEIARKYASSLDVIREFQVPTTKIVYVLNKVDMTSIEDAFDKAGQLGILDSKRVLPVSAKTGYNVDQLKGLMRSMLFETGTKKKRQRKKRKKHEGVSPEDWPQAHPRRQGDHARRACSKGIWRRQDIHDRSRPVSQRHCRERGQEMGQAGI